MTKLRPYLIALTILAAGLAPALVPARGIRSLSSSPAFAAVTMAPAADNDNNNGNGNGNNNNANSNANNNNDNNNDNSNNNNDNGDNNNDNGDNNNDNNNGNGNNNNANSNANNNDNGDNNNGNANNNNDNSNNNNDNSNNNDNGDNNNNGNGNDNGNDVDDGDDNDNNGDFVVPASPRSSAPAPAPVCSTPGQEMTFTSGDGRVQVKVFSSLSQSVKFSIRLPIDAASVPPAPGQVVGGLLFQLMAESCDGSPIAVLPAEVNLGVHYTDADAAGLNEQNFTLARLDSSANQWRQVTKQATDPPSNFTSATINEMGFYVLYQRS